MTRLVPPRALASVLALVVNAAAADELDRHIANTMKVYRLPAVAVGIVRDGRLVLARCRGLAQLELAVKARCDQRFEIGSISKQFTAYGLLILHDRGSVDVEAPLGRYLPTLPEAWARVTLHQLLTHTSGLPDLEAAFGYGIYRETPGDADFLARLVALPLDFSPGERWSYSNTNYWLAARVIEQVTGGSYEAFMRKEVYAPLGMNSTRSALPDQVLPGRASGYRRVGPRIENRDASRPNTSRGLGDIVSTLADMARWDREQLAPKLLAPQTAARARQPVRLNDGSTAPYGYGLDLEAILPRPSIQHTGQMAGFTANYVRVPELRLAAVVFVNAYASPVGGLARRALEHAAPQLRGKPPKAIPDTDPEVTARVRTLADTAPAASADWREEWFEPGYWNELRPWLGEIAEDATLFGPLRRLVLVERGTEDGDRTFTYQLKYTDLTHLVRFRLGADGRIKGRTLLDE